ncbi:MAG: putative serine/threonine protein kinase [Streblomastix strix]|uniref:Putative serine/threonine protein kinase n=1 Tax=Streblomastix strix TaxID=222440 RepID=A0A5J4WN29_9EUKA|nr:MAG: putative serine/threonine protein kinase [Streblomastix strix]
MQDKIQKYQEDIHKLGYIPIRPLGGGSFGTVFLIFNYQEGQLLAAKVIPKDKFEKKEWDAAIKLMMSENCIFVLKYTSYQYFWSFSVLTTEYANYQTLDIITKNTHSHLPSHTLRAIMKQILEGMRQFHSTGLIHRDIKCNNILLHNPPRSGRIHVKISDFGLAKNENLTNIQIYAAGTLIYMAPEIFKLPRIITQKVDIYAVGITFYQLITHQFPIDFQNAETYQKKMVQLKSIGRPSEIKDDLLWDLLSKMLEFDPDKRITAEQGLQHLFFTGREAALEISHEQRQLASLASKSKENGDTIIRID